MGSARMRWRAATIALLLPCTAAAQTTVRAGDTKVCEGGAEPVGSLGITGIACDRCQFFTNGKVHRAVFWTEPTILDLDAANPASAVLREGDVLVALDGQLITTRGGSARFSALPPDRPARLRIRRDGRMMEVSVPVAPVCPTAKSADAPVVAGRGVPAPPSPPAVSASPAPVPAVPAVPSGSVRVPPAPPVSATPPAAAVPAVPPAPEEMAPRASLGFGFRCGACGYRMDEGHGRWTFSEAPEVVGLDTDVAVLAGALRPGDLLVALDGLALTSEEGGRRFAEIRPGQRLRWTVERDGRATQVETRARDRVTGAVAPATPSADVSPVRGPLRFSGTVGNATIEVRGGRVNVTEDEGGKLVIIRTADTEIRIRIPGDEKR